MANNNSCVWNPTVGNKKSKMYDELINRIRLQRPLANYLYARYVASDIGSKMEAQRIKRNSQGQHSAQDYLDFIHFQDLWSEISNIKQAERQAGFIDNNDNRKMYDDAEQALIDADTFNEQHKAVVAQVNRVGSKFEIRVYTKDADTHFYPLKIKERLKVWEAYKQAFNSVGIDITSLPAEAKQLFSADNPEIIRVLQSIKRTPFRDFTESTLRTLLSMEPNATPVANLIRSFGSIENAVQGYISYLHNSNLRPGQDVLLKRAIEYVKKFKGLDLDALSAQINQITSQTKNMDPEEYSIAKKIAYYNKMCNIDSVEIRKTDKRIESLSDAATEALFVVERRIREIDTKIKLSEKDKDEKTRLSEIKDTILKQLAVHKYYKGVMDFLKESSSHILQIDDLIRDAQKPASNLEQVFDVVRTLQNIKKLKEKYYPIIAAMADDNVRIDQRLTDEEIENMRSSAKALQKIFDDKNIVVDNLIREAMGKLLLNIVGNTAPDGQLIENIINMAMVDSTKLDFLYSVGRASNLIVAAMGSIIQNAQRKRDPLINEYSRRIRKETNKLYESGSTSEFIYEESEEGEYGYYLLSDIDWDAFFVAKKEARSELFEAGYKKEKVDEMMEAWEENHTEERVVDRTNGRTERVPDKFFRKDNGLFWNDTTNKMEFDDRYTEAQKNYYNAMMQIKGEIGSMLPAYAQHQYLPPQIRRSMLDAISKAETAQDVLKAIGNKVANFWTIREDDTDFWMNGVIDGVKYQYREGGFDNTPLKQIPIFYINKVQQGELLRNFSSGLTALMGTAINYKCMSEVLDVAEFIRDFTIKQDSRDDVLKIDSVEDVIGNKVVSVMKDLQAWAQNNNTEDLLEGFIDVHFYGMKYSPKENPIVSKIANNIIAYTSFKGLSTNVLGATSNFLVGEFQMLVEAGAREFYGFRDFGKAHLRLIGKSGVTGDLMELATNNRNYKGVLFREMFDPLSENFSDKSHTKYYSHWFRTFINHDCSMLGYSGGEYLLHYINMYSVLYHEKVLLNGREIDLFDAFEVGEKEDGNSKLVLKQGVTQTDGRAIDDAYIDKIRRIIKYCNDTTHGAMDQESKGLIHRHWWGRATMNFRQWMVEHYSRRFRKRHFDAVLGKYREGYWTTLWEAAWGVEAKDSWEDGEKGDAILMFMRDWIRFTFNSEVLWSTLNDEQKANIRRVQTELLMYAILCMASFAIGDPDRFKRMFWMRFLIYQLKRLIMDVEAALPFPKMLESGSKILQSPMAGIQVFNSLLYIFIGLCNGDLFKRMKSGRHKGEIKYIKNLKMNTLPFFKHAEQLFNMDVDDGLFKIFDFSFNSR